MATKKGYELAYALNPYIGTTNAIAETCSSLCRAEATWERLGEEECNGHPIQSSPYLHKMAIELVDEIQAEWDARVEREQERIAKRMDGLVRDLPSPDDGEWELHLEPDPRGASWIVAPDGRQIVIP